MTPQISRPADTDYPPYYQTYVSLVPEGDILAILGRGLLEVLALLAEIPEERERYRYAPDKWSIRELVGHMIDGERIFAYRALRIARNDTTPLHGFDENEYVRNATFDEIPLAALAAEYESVRRSTIHLLRHLDAAAWERTGTANNGPISVRAIAYIIAGHELHHIEVIRSRYMEEV